jgi:alkaline phosphatase
MLRWIVVLALSLAAAAQTRAPRAKNVILFLGDGTGPSTVNAASIHGYGEPRSLYVQNMPYIGLSETSAASNWVSDSAAGMTAIVTGQKTHNGVISQDATAERKVKDGRPLKTILEYAEERGLSTGVVSNSSMADATPAACYAHANDRGMTGEIFAQVLKPSFGDGVDVIIGPGRAAILKATAALGIDLTIELPKAKFAFLDSMEALDALDPKPLRVVALFDGEFDLAAAVDHAVQILSRNPRGFFLMVESNNHSRNVKQTLDRTVTFDRIIRKVAGQFKRNSLILFTADHSYDLRLPRGPRGADIVPLVKVDGSHSAEEVLVTAEGPGASAVRGIFPNTRIFHIMMDAYGWPVRPATPQKGAAASSAAGQGK